MAHQGTTKGTQHLWMAFLLSCCGCLAFAPRVHAQRAGGFSIDVCDTACETTGGTLLITGIPTIALWIAQASYGASDASYPDTLAKLDIVLSLPWLALGTYLLTVSPGGLIPLSIGAWFLTHGIVSLSTSNAEEPAATRAEPRSRHRRPPGRTSWHASVVASPQAAVGFIAVDL